MLAISALAMLTTFMILILSERVSALVVLILTPLAFGLMEGFGTDLGPMMLVGVQQMAPTAVMLAFAILYFGLMVDVGLFDPIARFVVRIVDGDPVRITVGTVVLALVVSVDGNGATSYLICTSAMMPLYRKLGLNPMVLACLLVLSVSITHICPWAGPTSRVAVALGVNPVDVFIPLIPAMLVGAVCVIGLGYLFGRSERRRLGRLSDQSLALRGMDQEAPPEQRYLDAQNKRPKLFWLNLAVTIALLVCLMRGVLPLPVLFMIAVAIAFSLNYPSLKSQQLRISAHAPTVLKVISLTFAAGVFVGIFNGTGMASALAYYVAHTIPPQVGPYLAPIAGLLSLPFFFFTSNDTYFFGVLTTLSGTASHYGIAPVEMARAAAVGTAVTLLAPGIGSTYLLIGLVGTEYGRLQRFALKWAFSLSLILLFAAVLTRAIPMRGS